MLESDLPIREPRQRPAQGRDPVWMVLGLGRLFQLAPNLGGQDRGDDPLPSLDTDFQATLDRQRLRQLGKLDGEFETSEVG